MDKIYVEDLEVYAYHGVYSEEKKLGQQFLISMELSLSLRAAAKGGDLDKSVNYGELCHRVEEEFKKDKYDLIETAAENIAEFILLSYPIVESVKVKVKKPWAPIGRPLKYAAVEVERFWHKAYIALGSNMGDKNKNLEEAIDKINTGKTIVTKKSNLYTTKPVGYLDQDDFLNAAIEIKTLLSPEELISFLLDIEKQLKRERVVRWGPRTIDLDVLLYDNIITSMEEIIIPHPRMAERLFVMKPLSDIAPYVMHPILNKRVIEIVEELKKEE